MDKVRIYIVEDEGVTRITLEDCLENLGYEVAGWSATAEQAWIELTELQVDLVMLDIQLQGEKNGIWLAQQLRKVGKVPYIFLTAFGDAATVQEAVKTQPHGYLVKPFKPDDIFTSIAVALENFSLNKAAVDSKTKAQNNDYRIRDAIYVRDEYLFIKLHVNEIRYIKSDRNYLEIHLEEKRLVVRKSLKSLLELLPENLFFQVHKSYVVHIGYIDSFTASRLHVKGQEIPIGDAYKEDFAKRFTRL